MDNDLAHSDFRKLLRRDLEGIIEDAQLDRVLSALGRCGLRVVKADDKQTSSQNQDLLQQIQDPSLNVPELLQLWQSRQLVGGQWAEPEAFARLAKRFIDLGVPYSAREVAEAGVGLAKGEKRLELLHLLGLALGRCGLVEAASRVLSDPELAQFPRNEEMRGLEAALQKQMGLKADRPELRAHHLRASLDLYEAAWKASDGSFWTGINVASLHRLLGDHEQAAQIARHIEIECLQENAMQQDNEQYDPYWLWATLGEAKLNQAAIDEAEKWYRRAASIARCRVGHLNSSRRQLRYLLAAIDEDQSLADAWLPIPGVAIFTGHRIDQSHRQPSRFPPALETMVKDAILKWLVEQNVRSCVSSAANGADILFLEALQSLEGSDTRIVLPFSEAEFIKECVMNGQDNSWVSRFSAVLKRASRVTIASSERLGHDDSPFEYANRIIFGQGRMIADELQTSITGLAVWDGTWNAPVGGTAHTIQRWLQHELKVYAIELNNLPSPRTIVSPISPGSPACLEDRLTESTMHRANDDAGIPVKSMLFADAVGFSQLKDHEVQLFITHFLGCVAKCIEKYAPEYSNKPELWPSTSIGVRETWGDGLYFAMNDVRTAGCFALDLCDAVRNIGWRDQFGFSQDLSIRIALHSGPVHLSIDPITSLPKCTGTHVSRAARLEPKTPPNHVYASDAFASLAAEARIAEFKCEFVKLLDWAKHYGTYPTYVVTRNLG